MFEPQAMSEGRIIDDRYRLIKKVGEGASASVWEAEHIKLHARVAVKLLHRRAPPESDMAQRFMREARVAASVKHANVIEILDFGIAEGDEPYMVMEFLRGFSLAKYQEELGTLPIAEAIRLVALTLKGLAVVHEAGIIHRDVKPDNIFLVRDDDGLMPKLLDFGLSRHQGKTNVTHEGTLLGTPDYMSPEQARGRGDIDARADLYSTGVILYHLLTRRLPFEAHSVGELLVLIASAEPTPIEKHRSDLPAELARIVRKSTARLADERYPDARAMRADLLRMMETGQVGQLDPGLWAFTPAVPSGLPTMREESVPAEVRKALEHELALRPPTKERKDGKDEKKTRNPYGEDGDPTDGVSTSKTGVPEAAQKAEQQRVARTYTALVATLLVLFVGVVWAFFHRGDDGQATVQPVVDDPRSTRLTNEGDTSTGILEADNAGAGEPATEPTNSESIGADLLPAEPDMQFIDTTPFAPEATEIPPLAVDHAVPEPRDPPPRNIARPQPRRTAQSNNRHTTERRRTTTRTTRTSSSRTRSRRR